MALVATPAASWRVGRRRRINLGAVAVVEVRENQTCMKSLAVGYRWEVGHRAGESPWVAAG